MFKNTKHNMIIFCTILLAISDGCFGNGIPQPTSHQIQNDQYIHEKQDPKVVDQLVEEQDPYHLTNDYKFDQQPYNIWNPYRQTPNNNYPLQNRVVNFIGYSNPVFLPLPVLIQPNYLYPYSMIDNNYEDQLSRANSRRPTPFRNSPIYYVRVPPTPYMFVPGLGYTSQPPTFTPNFTPLMPYNPIQTLPIQSAIQQAISPLINLPLNFLANGKPTNIYQLDPNDISQQYQPFTPPSPQPPLPPPSVRPYRPTYQPFTSPDSKITHLKRPFIFNGKPEEIYLLPNNFNNFNNFNPMQSLQSVYQPSPLQNYY